jgi:hypothetical protein
MAGWWHRGIGRAGAVCLAAVVGGVFSFAVCWFAGVAYVGGSSQFENPATYLHAEAAARGETVAVATGAVDEDVEGLFTIDFLTGELQCFVLYVKGPGANKIGGHFKRNVVADLGLEKGKKPKYLLVTGRANFTRGAAGVRPGFSVVYVIDDNSGKFAVYGLHWDKTKAVKGVPQAGTFILLDKKQNRVAPLRDMP